MRVEKYLTALGVDPDRVSILVTHSHSDHVGGLKVFCKRHPHAALYCQPESMYAVMNLTGVTPRSANRNFMLGALSVEAVPVPHDVPCFGYVLRSVDKSVAVVTDVGMVKPDVLSDLCACDIVMLEANHDPEKLRMNRTYTPQLKARIASPHGHLSNADCAEACAFLASRGVKNFILAHLSQDNNDPELAVSAVLEALGKSGTRGARVVAAAQDRPTGLFEVC